MRFTIDGDVRVERRRGGVAGGRSYSGSEKERESDGDDVPRVQDLLLRVAAYVTMRVSRAFRERGELPGVEAGRGDGGSVRCVHGQSRRRLGLGYVACRHVVPGGAGLIQPHEGAGVMMAGELDD